MTPPFSPQTTLTVSVFVQRFSSTQRGARLARLLAVQQLNQWDIPYGSPVSETAALVVAELAANAITHGHVPGRDFELRLTLRERLLVVDVSDARGELWPPGPGPGAVRLLPSTGDHLHDHGRGLVLVDALADRWKVLGRLPVGKTVRAELSLDSRRP